MATHLIAKPKGRGMSWKMHLDWGCLSKHSFRTPQGAQKSAQRPGRSTSSHLLRGHCEPYRGSGCASWHVGAGR